MLLVLMHVRQLSGFLFNRVIRSCEVLKTQRRMTREIRSISSGVVLSTGPFLYESKYSLAASVQY